MAKRRGLGTDQPHSSRNSRARVSPTVSPGSLRPPGMTWLSMPSSTTTTLAPLNTTPRTEVTRSAGGGSAQGKTRTDRWICGPQRASPS